MAQGEEPNMGQGTAGAKGHGENLQDLEAQLESIKAYLKAEAKTEKDAKALKARLNLTGEERDLTSEEEECKKNLKAEQMQTREGLEEIKTDLEKIKEDIDCASEEKGLKELRKQADKYLREVEERLGAVERGEENQII